MTMKPRPLTVRLTVVVTIDPEAWQLAYGVDASDRNALREDVASYLTTHVQETAGRDEDAITDVTVQTPGGGR